MATVYVSGETMLRPVRMGLAITPGSGAGLRRAVELAVGSWGGQGFPIVEVAADHEPALRLAVAMGVDCLFPVGDGEDLKALARTPGFEWVASWQGLSPFSRDAEGRGEHVLPASSLYDWYRLARPRQPPMHHISWPHDHELADLLMVWFGRFGDDDAGQADRAAFEATAQGCPLGPGLPLPPRPMSMANQLTITMQDVIQQPRWQSRGIVVVEGGNVAHLVSFWNLRASGQEVFPWVESHANLLEQPLSDWLEKVASATPAGSGRPADLSLWLPPGAAAIPPRLSALVGDGRFQLMPEAHDLDLRVSGPLMTSHVRRFTLDTGRGGEAVIPLPVLDFLPRRASWTDLGMVAANIDVWQESNDPVGETGIVVPAARCVAPHLRSFIPFTRPRPRGRVIPVRVSEETVSLMPVTADFLAQKLADDAGFRLTLTENGRRVHHLIRLLGGITGGGITGDSLANQPAVREVVRQALRSPYGASPALPAPTAQARSALPPPSWASRSDANCARHWSHSVPTSPTIPPVLPLGA